MSGFVSKVAETYAEALLAFAKSRDALKETTIEMNLISRLLKVSVELQKFLSNPLNGREVKKNIVKDVLGDQIDPNTMKFLFLLIDRNRIVFLDEIAKKFLELSYKEESIEVAKVVSSVELSGQQQKSLATKLKQITGAKQIKLALKVDPELIGGFTVEMGSTFIDTSIKNQLSQLANTLGA